MRKIKLYNTLSRTPETLKPLRKNRVLVYTCGPTVYNNATIGNLRAYIFADTLVRALAYLGYRVRHAMNITDVGHLVSDADEGEDKMDIAAKREQKSPLEIARQYEKTFFLDEKLLNIRVPKKRARATETIKEQLAIIKLLEKRGHTYKTQQAVYFDISKFRNYGALSGQKLDEKKSLSREELVDDPEKKHSQDFALWMFTVGAHAHHILRWQSPWGEGFPGWHIECSAISRKLLGQPFDIHTGGVDHIGVHHENEIAQSTAAFGVPLAHVWMHNEHLLVEGKRMGKSMGNAYTLADIMKKGYSPAAFRYFCLQASYRSLLNFTWKGLDGSQTALNEVWKFMSSTFVPAKKDTKTSKYRNIEIYKKDFTDAISNDLNTPQALAVVWKLIKDNTITLRERQKLVLQFDEVLGLGLEQYAAKRIPLRVQRLIRARHEARTNKQFIQSDALRKTLEELGYGVDDVPEGTAVYPYGSQNSPTRP